MATGGDKAKGFMVEELRREREASSLDILELTNFVEGGEVFSEKKRTICKSQYISHLFYSIIYR